MAVAATSAGAALPDGRAWEQVTPVDKNGGDVGSLFGQPATGVPVSADANRIVYLASTPFGDAPNGLLTVFFRADRTATGWTSTSISYPLPSKPNVLDSEVPGAFTSDLSHGIFTTPFPYDAADDDADPLNFAPTGRVDQYLFGDATPKWLSRGSQGDGSAETYFGGATPDLSKLVFEGRESLEPAAAGLDPSGGFYLYLRSGGSTQLVNVDNGGSLLDSFGAVLGSGTTAPSIGGAADSSGGVTKNALTSDGSKVFFESPAPGGPDPSQLYMRDISAGTTTDLSQPDTGVVDPNGTQSATYAGAAADGSKVFFTTTQQLTADDTNDTNDVYVYDTGSGTLARASRGESGTADANVDGVTLVSDDGSRVYFVAEHQLVNGHGTDGQPNLYRYDTGTGATTFVATLSPGDQLRLWSGTDAAQEAYATSDGGVLAFTSQANLTSYDAQGHWEVYVYRVGGGIECASCRPDGSPPTGDADFGPVPNVRNPFWEYGIPLPLTTDGSRVFFETNDSLVPGDANAGAPVGGTGVPGAEDVYEYAGGDPQLVSDGHSTTGSLFAGASRTGDDVFFYTRASLVPQDTDGGSLDVYDARVGGGFPPPPGSADCGEDGCHPAPTQAPFLPVPTSTSAPSGKARLTGPTFNVLPISRAAAARTARSGRLRLRVRVSESGRISARAFARIGHHRRRVASAAKRFSRAAIGTLTLKLSKPARSYLRHHRRLRLQIQVTYSRGGLKRIANVTLLRRSR